MTPLLDGVVVLDLCRLATLATTKLADLGAEVIKIEEPPHGDYLRGLPPILPQYGVGLFYLMMNRNKKSVGLNLKSDEGRRIFFELLAGADALVEVSKPGAFARLGLDYESVRAAKPDIIYCSVTGYGQTGPYRDLPSHGMNIDAAAGLLQIERGPDGRPEIKVASALGLEMGGANAALGVLAALHRRTVTGEGAYLDISCWDGAVAHSTLLPPALNMGSAAAFDNPLRPGGIGPKYNVYGTKDDKVLLICPIEKKFWVAFCAAVGKDEWAGRGRYDGPMDYGESDPQLRDDIEEVMRTRTLDEWMETLLAADVPVSPVLGPDDLVDNPHAEARGMFGTTDDPRYAGLRWVSTAVRATGTGWRVALPPPVLGEHTTEILGRLGYDDEAQARLRADGVIA
ncbi:MAG: CaiB/BaiF CoA-transferase family protein [Actinomycetota bacterium]|jgi:alpha-methylacyl-CoA racemase